MRDISDILNHALRGDELPKTRPGVAKAGAAFLKALGNGTDAWAALKTFGEFITEAEQAEIMNVLLGGEAEGDTFLIRARVLNLNAPSRKIDAIKTVRSIVHCGLKEAKDFIEDNLVLEVSAKDYRCIERDLVGTNFEIYRVRRR